MKYQWSIIIFTILLSVPFCAARAQREASYRVLLDDPQVPKEVKAAFKARYLIKS